MSDFTIDDLHGRLTISLDTHYEGESVYLVARLHLDGAELSYDSVSLPRESSTY